MCAQKNLITICETNPVLALLKQRNRQYPLEIIHRLFRDEYAVEAPIEDFLRVCAVVREELQAKEGGGNYLMTTPKMLDAWCVASKDSEPWFAMTDDPRKGRMVALRPAARAALEIAISLDEDADQTSGATTRAYFQNITGAAAHLRQDASTTLAKLEAEIEERRRKIAEIETKGLQPATEEERERYAIELSRFVSNLLTTLGKVPSRLRENLRDAREAFNALDGTHGDIMRRVLEMLTEERRRPGYRTLEALNEIHNNTRERQHVEDAMKIVIEECGDYLSDRTRREAGALFRSLSDISLRILSEDHDAACQMANLVQSETFERRLGQSRLLMELSETMRAKAHLMHLRLRGPSEMPCFRLGAEREEGVKIHWFDLRLAEAPPAPLVQETQVRQAVVVDREQALADAEQASAKSAYLDAERLATWIRNIVAKNGPTPLSRIISFRPLTFGLDEIAAFMNIAMTKAPAEFRPGWEMEIVFNGDAGSNTAVLSAKNLLIRCPDPVFMASGLPGRGLLGGQRASADRSDLSGLLAAHHVHAQPTADGVAVRVVRPQEAIAA